MPERNPAVLLGRKERDAGSPSGRSGPARCAANTTPEANADPVAPADATENNVPADDHRAMEPPGVERPRRGRPEAAATRHKAITPSDKPIHTVASIAQQDGVSPRHIWR